MLLPGATAARFDRYAAIPGLMITSAICYALLALNLSGYRSSEGLRDWIRAQRVTITIAVQVLSHVLGLIHVQVICTLIKLTFIRSLRKRSFQLHWAQFAQAASTPRMSWDLPLRSCLLLSLIVLSAFVPAAMWAPALAPLLAERTEIQTLNIPTFEIQGTNFSKLWDGDQSTVINTQWMSNGGGLFSFDAAVTKSLMQTSSGDASVKTDGLYKHPKLDKTGYSYISRSQGAGSIAGYHRFNNVTAPTGFTYQENVLTSKVDCFYLDKSRWNISSLGQLSNGPLVYQSKGKTPSGKYGGGGGTYIGWLPHDIFIWASSQEPSNRTIAIQFATLATQKDDDWGFSDLDRMQCNIDFKLRTFFVSVNTTSKLITANSTGDTELAWPNYGNAVVLRVSDWLGAQSWLDSGCFGGCPLGRSIVGNVRQLQNITGDTSNATTIQGVKDYLATMTDNILVNLHLTRMASNAPGATKPVSVTVGIPAVRYGDFKFIVLICAINTLITTIYVFELVRTRAWAGMPDLDISNISSVLISALKGGMAFERSQDHSTKQTFDESTFTEFTRMRVARDEFAPTSTLLVPVLKGQAGSIRTFSEVEQDRIQEKQAFLDVRGMSH